MYTVWTDYGREGWKPEDFETEEECVERITSGNNGSGGNFRITEQCKLVIF